MKLRLVGSSHYNVFVYCYHCTKKFVWLNAYVTSDGFYIPICRKCKLKIDKIPNDNYFKELKHIKKLLIKLSKI